MATIVAEYHALSELLERAGMLLELPELHGGMQQWVQDCLQDCGAAQAAQDELREQLSELGNVTWQALSGLDMTFEPLLPDDDAPLGDQVQALASWCHGFLAGLYNNRYAAGRALPVDDGNGAKDEVNDLREIIGDFSQISRAAMASQEESDDSQTDFALAELKEYVRVSAQLVFETLAGQQRNMGGQRLH